MPGETAGAAAVADTQGLTQVTSVEKTPETSKEAQELAQIEKAYKDVGLDFRKLNPKEVRKTFDTMRKVGAFDWSGWAKAEAQKLAEEEIRRREQTLKGKGKARKDDVASDEDDEDSDPQAQLEKRLMELEAREQQKAERESQHEKDVRLQRQWIGEYQELAQDYPILMQDPDVASAVQVVTLGYIASHQNDPKLSRAAEQPGFVKTVVPTVLELILKAGRKLAARVPDEVKPGDAPAPEKFDFANADEDSYRKFLAQGLKRRS